MDIESFFERMFPKIKIFYEPENERYRVSLIHPTRVYNVNSYFSNKELYDLLDGKNGDLTVDDLVLSDVFSHLIQDLYMRYFDGLNNAKKAILKTELIHDMITESLKVIK